MLRSLLAVATIALACLPAACVKETTTAEEDESHIQEPEDGVFKSTNDFAFSLSAPFKQLFTRFLAGQADPPKERPDAGLDAGPTNPNDLEPSYSEPGKLKLGTKTFDIRVQVRGNTSPRDCAFPKYKIEFANKEQTAGTPFQGNKTVRINSHCGFGGPTDRGGTFQRIQNQISPIREELAYRTVRAAGINTYRTRLAKIAYEDTSAASPLAKMEQYGLMIEAGDVAAKRFAKAGIIDKDKGVYMNDPKGRPTNVGADVSKMREEDVASVFLMEALLGNLDWIFEVGSPGSLWNIDVFGVPHEAPQIPIPQDFDLACAVHVMRDPATQVQSEIAKFRSRFGAKPEVSKKAIAVFKEHKAAILSEIAAVEKADIEKRLIPSTDRVTSTDQGFVNAHKLFDTFYALDEFTK